MLDALQKKLINFLVLRDLIELYHNFPFQETKVEKIQKKKLARLVKVAYRNPFYRKRFQERGLTPRDIRTPDDLLKLPLLKKAELRDWVKSEYEKNPKKYQYWFRDSTSGSTGAPLVTYLSAHDKAYNMAAWIRMGAVQGLNPFLDSTFCLVSPHRLKNQKDSILQNFQILKRTQVSYLATPQEMVQRFNEEKPAFMYANKSQYVQMALYAQKNHVKLWPLKLYASAAETLDKPSRDLIESQFGENRMYDTYGSTETGALAFERKGQPGRYVICHDTHIVHTLDQDGKPASCGRAVITSLYHYGFPIINYDLGDGLDTFEEDGLKYISKIHGRLDDWIKFEDGEKLPFHFFYEVMEKRKEVSQFRIIQENYHLVRILLTESKDNTIPLSQIEAVICKELEHLFQRSDIHYVFEWLDVIPFDENGKLRMLISKV